MKSIFLFRKNKDKKKKALYSSRKDKNISVAMFSSFFNQVNDDMFCTNQMYSAFKDELLSTIEIYHPKAEITVSIYEEKQSNDSTRNMLQIGFRKYINALYQKSLQGFVNQLITISIFMIVGILLVYFAYQIRPNIQEWLFYVTTNFGTVLIWQFVGYWAFEYADQKRELLRFKQLENIQYEFKKWE